MVKYTRENIKGLIFKNGTSVYHIINSLPNMHIKSLTSDWEDKVYCDANLIIQRLNDGSYKVKQKEIYELW